MTKITVPGPELFDVVSISLQADGVSLLSAVFKGSSWGCHPCVEFKNQMSSLSSESTALKAKWHGTTMLFHTADKNDSMALANDTWSDPFLSKHKFGKQELVGPAGWAGISFIYFKMGFAGITAIDRTGDIVPRKDPASFWSCPFIPAGTNFSSSSSGGSLLEPWGLSPIIPPWMYGPALVLYHTVLFTKMPEL